MNNPIDFSKKFLSYLKGECTAQEADDIRQQLENNEALRQLEQEFRDKQQITDYVTHMQRFDVEVALKKVLSSQDHQTRKTRTISLRLLRYAAAILILLFAGAGFWYSRYTKVTPPDISETVQLAMQQSRESGKQDAEVVSLSEELKAKGDASGGSEESSMRNEDSSSASGMDNSSLTTLQASLTKDQLLAAKRITTRHDKEFWVTLDDGTLVHLNYNTRLIYPEKFGRGDRNVILDGEAYFMVAKDKSRPFVVHTPDGDVKVYGTEFNVNTRANEGKHEGGTSGTTVVLVKGSVSVTPTGGNEVMMQPGQQASLQDQQLSLRVVDVEPYVAWNTGAFMFDDCPLEQLMDVLSRWYGVKAVYESEEISSYVFAGDIDKYLPLEKALKGIHQITGLRIELKDGCIYIGRK